MRYNEIRLTEDERQKSIVMRQLKKMDADAPLFTNIYKDLINKPLGGRIENYVRARGDQDAIDAIKYLLKTIPTVGTAEEVKEFMSKFQDPKFDPINVKPLISGSMEKPAPLATIVKDPFAKKLFDQLHLDFKGKGDAGPGEAALAVLSPNITYTSPGDIQVGNKKVEVKASTNKGGAAGRTWDHPVHQKPMLEILAPLGMQSFSVMQGNEAFPGTDEQKDAFIKAACEAWFGQPLSNIIASFGTPNFKDVWQAAVFDRYAELSGHQGVLAIGLTTYQYVESGEDFARYMKKKSQGSLCRATEKQSRALAPQIAIS